MRLLDGVKKPNVFTFFSTRTMVREVIGGMGRSSCCCWWRERGWRMKFYRHRVTRHAAKTRTLANVVCEYYKHKHRRTVAFCKLLKWQYLPMFSLRWSTGNLTLEYG